MRGANQPIQLVIRVANLFLWKLSAQGVEGILEGIAKENFRIIQKELGPDKYIDDAKEVKRLFRTRSKLVFGRYGAGIERINIAQAIPCTEGWIAKAILQSGNPAASAAVGAAVSVKSVNGDSASP